MKQIKLFSMMLLLATMFLSFNACSSDDEDKKEENSIVGKWKLINSNGSVHTHLEFKSNGTFEYTSTKEPEYEEHGKWKIESDGKLYFLFSDEDTWWTSKIHEVNSISLVLEEYLEDNTTLSGDKDNYQRIK